MPYTITPSEDGTYIHLKVEGDITRQTAMEQNIEAHQLGDELGINYYLVDVTEARNVESAVDNYEWAYSDMQMAPEIDLCARVATLVAPDDHSHDFIETLARNTGMNVRLFRDLGEALAFLGAPDTCELPEEAE